MLNLNKAMIIGNATVTQNCVPLKRQVCRFFVATNRRYTDGSGEQREEAQYHEIVAWGSWLK